MNLPETSIWEPGIYQLETTDLVLGGPSPTQGGAGISNLQAEQLANRTGYLYDRLGRFEAVNTMTISASLSLAEGAIRNTHLVIGLQVNSNAIPVTLPGENAVTNGVVASISIANNGANNGKHIRLTCPNGMTFVHRASTIYDNTVLYLYSGEAVKLVKSGNTWIVLSAEANIYDVGEIQHRYKPPVLSLEARGQLVSRIGYARLWAWLQTAGAPVVPESTYAANQLNYSGVFTTGDGSTTFRMPDLRSVFIRGLDNGRGLDIGRPYNNGGGYEADEFKSHAHGYNPGDNNGVSDDADDRNVMIPGSQSRQTDAVGGAETRPKNVAYTAYIKY